MLQLNDRFSVWKKEISDWSEQIEVKRKSLDAEIREFNERKFNLEQSKLLTLNGKIKKK